MTTQDSISVARIAKVNHAGEYGAIRIYGAQIFVTRLLWPHLVDMLTELQNDEVRHCALFRSAMSTRNVIPCRTMSIWSIGGATLGFITALLGPKTIWACTKSVEETVHKHLSHQLHFLENRDEELFSLINGIRAEEEAHVDLAVSQKGSQSIFTNWIESIVARSVNIIVWLSTWGESSKMHRSLENFEALQ